MKANLMGDAPASEMEWNEHFFRDCFDNVVKVVTWISRKGNPFDRHQTIAPGLQKKKVFKVLTKDTFSRVSCKAA
jgi:hypothetical protein